MAAACPLYGTIGCLFNCFSNNFHPKFLLAAAATAISDFLSIWVFILFTFNITNFFAPTCSGRKSSKTARLATAPSHSSVASRILLDLRPPQVQIFSFGKIFLVLS